MIDLRKYLILSYLVHTWRRKATWWRFWSSKPEWCFLGLQKVSLKPLYLQTLTQNYFKKYQPLFFKEITPFWVFGHDFSLVFVRE